MWTINQAYIDGKFVTVSGKETIEIFNPATEQLIGTVKKSGRFFCHPGRPSEFRHLSRRARTRPPASSR